MGVVVLIRRLPYGAVVTGSENCGGAAEILPNPACWLRVAYMGAVGVAGLVHVYVAIAARPPGCC